MKIIEPSVELVDNVDGVEVLKKIERCGRVCYQSSPKGKPANFVRMLIKRGHESVLEHVSLTFHIICDRAIMAELTRHRLCAFSVESTRYCKYDELTFVSESVDFSPRWSDYLKSLENNYKYVVQIGLRPELARIMLPLCLKTELYMTANLRELRHILKLRTSAKAHPQMRVVAGMILAILKEKLPVIVEDI